MTAVLSVLSLFACVQVHGVTWGEGFGEPAEWRDAQPNDTLYPIQINNQWGYMNQKGHLVIMPVFDWADYFYDGLARAVVDGHTGFIHSNGNWYIPPRFVYADRFADGRAIVGNGTHFGFIDQRGKLLIPVRLDGALRYREGFAAVLANGRCGFLDVGGGQVGRTPCLRVRSFHDGRAMVQLAAGRQRGPLGYFTGRRLWTDEHRTFSDLGDFHDGLARARVKQRWGYIDKRYKIRLQPSYADARDFTNGVAAVKVDDKWGYIDKSGSIVVKPHFDRADDFDGDLAMVQVNGRYGYIDRIGRTKIEPQFENAEPFFRSYARVWHEGDFGYIDRTGRLVWDPRRIFEHGIVDVRAKEAARIAVTREAKFNRKVHLPAARASMPGSYPPDYLYEKVLPPRRR